MTQSKEPAHGAAPQVVRRKRGSWGPKSIAAFFATLETACNVTQSAAAAGMSVSAAYSRKQSNREFAEQWQHALEVGYSELELALLRRSIHGTQTKTVKTGADGELQYELTSTGFNFSAAIHLLRHHRDEVETNRRKRDAQADETDGIERARAVLDEIDARLSTVPEAPGEGVLSHE